jgi:hypothetical protein
MRAEQFRELFTWTARRPLPVAVDERNPFVWPILNRAPDGRMVLGLINCSTDTYPALTLVVPAAPDELFLLDEHGVLKPASFEVVDSTSGRTRLCVPCEAPPLSVITLVYRQQNDQKRAHVSSAGGADFLKPS